MNIQHAWKMAGADPAEIEKELNRRMGTQTEPEEKASIQALSDLVLVGIGAVIGICVGILLTCIVWIMV